VKWTYSRLLSLCFVLSLPLVNPIVHGDGVGYYAYVRAALIQHDLHFDEDWRHGNPVFAQSRTEADGRLLPWAYTKTGYVSNLFAVGAAVLWFPFLVIAHLCVLSWNFFGGHVPADGFSGPYLLAMAIGTAVYGFAGLMLAFMVARKYVAEKWAFLATLGIWFGSSLPVYMYFNPAWSHAHSCFVVALFIWYWERTRASRTFIQWLGLGLIAGLMIDVYYPNGVLLLLPFTEVVSGLAHSRETKFHDLKLLVAKTLLFVGMIFLGTLPIFITRKIIFGGYLDFGSYTVLPWDWSAPHWSSVLFSSDHGLLTWTPLVGIALIGLFFPPRNARSLVLSVGVAVVGFYYVISSYPYWDGLSSFGNRFFISLTPVFVFGLALFLSATARFSSSSGRAFAISSALLTCIVCWNLGFIFQGGAHLIPVRGPISWSQVVHNQFVTVPREIEGYVNRYIFHRRTLMRDIENRDIEQLKNSQP
jgi:hypothetical protein